jgi:DNA helicase II / ATP-dependent DNA helicase PcrA
VFELVAAGRAIHKRYQGAINWLEAASSEFGEIISHFELAGAGCKNVLEESARLMIGDMEKRDIDTANLAIADLGMFACPDANLKLLTIHGAKGREFDAVAIVDLHEGRLPHWSVTSNQERVEESKRLFYVAVTRARKILLYVTDRSDSRNRPTRFLQALSPKVVTVRSS